MGFSKPVTLRRGKFYVTVYDLGGGVRIRPLWKNYFSDVHGAIFVVDSADTERMDEVKREFVECFKHPMLQGKPILIFANKQDLKEALDEAEISQQMGLNELTSSSHLVVKTIADAKKNGDAFDERIFEGLNWLLKSVTSDYQRLNSRVKVDQAAAKAAREERRAAQAARVKERKRRAAEGKEDAKASAPADPGVPMCNICSVTPATGRSAASNWLPVCTACGDGLKRGEDPSALAAAARGGAAGGGAGGAGGPAAAAEAEEEDAGPKCTVCTTRAATKKSAKTGWKPVCDECDAELERQAAESSEPTDAAGGDAGGETGNAVTESSTAAGSSAAAVAATAVATSPIQASPPTDEPPEVAQAAEAAAEATSTAKEPQDEAAAAGLAPGVMTEAVPEADVEASTLAPLPGALASPAGPPLGKPRLAPLGAPGAGAAI